MTDLTRTGTPTPRESPTAGALWGWLIGCGIGPGLSFLGELLRTGNPFAAIGETAGLLCLTSVMGMPGLPLGLIGGRLALSLRNRWVSEQPAKVAAGTGTFVMAIACWAMIVAVFLPSVSVP
ncbi:MAG: hypothetical protein AAF907_02960 [Planctomycetota bacterium]